MQLEQIPSLQVLSWADKVFSFPSTEIASGNSTTSSLNQQLKVGNDLIVNLI